MNILISGINGFLGKQLAIHLDKLGHKIYGISKSNVQEKLLNIIYLNIDLNHSIDLKIFKGVKIDLIYNLAWSNLSKKHNYEDQINNLVFSLNILDLSLKLNVNKIIFIGSTLEFTSLTPIDERTPIKPQNHYGLVKSQIRNIIDFYKNSYNLNIIYVISTSIIGAGRTDFNIVDYTIYKLNQLEDPIYENLNQFWSFLYIDDFLLMISNIGLKTNNFNTYFIGNNECNYLYIFIEKVFHAYGKKLPIVYPLSPIIYNSCLNLSNYICDFGLPKFKNFDFMLSSIIKKI